MTAWYDDESHLGSAAPVSTEAGTRCTAPLPVHRSRVFVIMEVRLFREALVTTLSRYGSIDIVGTSGVEAAPKALLELRPDVVLLSSLAPGALCLLRQLKDMASKVKVVVFALAADADLLAWAAAGASGYVDSAGSAEDLVAAIRAAAHGEIPCPPRLATLMLARIGEMSSRQPFAGPIPGTLTRREREVLDFVEAGLCNKEIARRLGLGHATIKNHVHHILTKLHARRRGELLARVRREQARAIGPHRPSL